MNLPDQFRLDAEAARSRLNQVGFYGYEIDNSLACVFVTILYRDTSGNSAPRVVLSNPANQTMIELGKVNDEFSQGETTYWVIFSAPQGEVIYVDQDHKNEKLTRVQAQQIPAWLLVEAYTRLRAQSQS